MQQPQSRLPSPDISPADLWTQLTEVPRPYRLVDFPRKLPDGGVAQLAIVVLTQEESMSATTSTERHVRRVLKEQSSLPGSGEPANGYNSLFEKREAVEILFRCCKRADDITKNFFPAIEAIGLKLTTDEIAVLLYNYLRVQSEIGPIVSSMSQGEVDAWIERLATGGATFFLDSLSLGAMSTLVTSMASRLFNSQTGKCFAGWPLDASTSGESEGS